MSTFYYELSTAGEKIYGTKYYVTYTQNNESCGIPRRLGLYSNRIWKKTNGTVKFVKHRYYNECGTVPVDMEEFFLVMLSASIFDR